MSRVGLEPSLAMKNNKELSRNGELLISKFVKGYLRAVLSRVPEEMIT